MRRGYVILDFETTGLAPSRGERVLEVGAVYMDPDLRIDGGIETLVNPQRDVGPTRIQGITARDVFDAPTFDRVAPGLFNLLDGRVIVGHNIAFDLRFLAAEMEREGYEVPEFVAIDTLQVAKSLLKNQPPQSFKLHDIAAHFGFGINDVLSHAGLESRPEHSALGDAVVTAYLLGRFIEMSDGAAFWTSHLDRAENVQWPKYVPVEVDARRRGDTRVAVPDTNSIKEASVSDVLHALGAVPPSVSATANYVRLLEESLADRVLDSNEVDALIATARALALDGVTLGSLHRGHFDNVVRAAWVDGVVTSQERADILRVAELLGIDGDSLREALGEQPAWGEKETSVSAQVLAPGSAIVLTGDMTIERSVLEREIVSLGFTIGGGVNKKTILVIAADPYTQSGKAKKARDYGIAVLGEVEGLALVRSSRSAHML